MYAGPGHPLRFAQPQEQLELLGEELVVVAQVVAEERKRLDERAAAGHDLGAALRQQVKGRKILEDPHRVVRSEHRDSARETDARRPLGGCRKHDHGCGDREVRSVVLADPEDVEADLVGELDLLDQIP